MRTRRSATRASAHALAATGLVALIWGVVPGTSSASDAGQGDRADAVAKGRDLFLKEWGPGIASEHGGDGLGPVYNDTSCVACHNLGGPGGAGPANKNVDLLTAIVTPVQAEESDGPLSEARRLERELRANLAELTGRPSVKPRAKGTPLDRAPLIALHAGFRDSSSVVLHRFGVAADYEEWRLPIAEPMMAGVMRVDRSLPRELNVHLGMHRGGASMPFEHGHFTLISSQRNPSPLFGTGLIDAVDDEVLEAAAFRRHPGFPDVQGRVHRLADGRIGRFGWKAQAATLDDFVLTACAVELGLEVPGHPQAQDPRPAARRAPGPDLSRSECDTLTAYVRNLPAPVERRPASAADARRIEAGRVILGVVGCTTCHVPKLGEVEGIYSDLLLHDMGEQLSDRGAYGRLESGSAEEEDGLPARMPDGPDAFLGAAPAARGPSRREWRTPPLWGLRDSAPYLHDGRAETLEQAVALHGGQGQGPTSKYFALPPEGRVAVEAFLRSLAAPTGTEPARPTR